MKNDKFYKTIQCRELNALPHSDSRRRSIKEENVREDGDIEVPTLYDNVFLLLIKYDALSDGIPTTAWILLKAILIYWTSHKNDELIVEMPITEYLKMRNLKDSGDARKQIKQDLKALEHVGYSIPDGKTWIDIRLWGGTMVQSSKYITFNFNPSFSKQLQSCKLFMDVNADGLMTDVHKNPHAFYLQEAIDKNWRINEGKDRVTTMSVLSLLTNLPLIPSKAEAGKRLKEKIIYPFIRDLKSLSIQSKVIDCNGNVLDPKKIRYDEFIKAKILLDYSDYPTHHERINAKASHYNKEK